MRLVLLTDKETHESFYINPEYVVMVSPPLFGSKGDCILDIAGSHKDDDDDWCPFFRQPVHGSAEEVAAKLRQDA